MLVTFANQSCGYSDKQKSKYQKSCNILRTDIFKNTTKNSTPPKFNFSYNISFGNKASDAKKISEKVTACLNYIEQVKIKKGWPSSFWDLDVDKIEDICADIPILNGLKGKDLAIISNDFESILLQRGCPHKCSHCGADSTSKITTMKWENFTELVDVIKILIKRLHFNPFSRGKEVYPFHDSDPMLLRMKDSEGKVHSIFDAAKYFYESTGSRFALTTAGWDKNNKISQDAAEKLVKNPDYLSNLNISIHPFHKDIQRSIQLENIGEKEKANTLRNHYIENMSNVIKTTNGLLKEKKPYWVVLQYLEDTLDAELNEESAKNLLRDILIKVKEGGTSVNSFIDKYNRLKPDNISTIFIGSYGRARTNYFPRKPIRNMIGTAHLIAPDGKILIKEGFPGYLSSKPFEETPYALNFRF